MKTHQDPVIQDLNSWINRSAGQHKRYTSEGTESARRLQSLPVQTDEEAMNLKKWRAQVIANGLMRRVDTSQLGARDGISEGDCRTDLPIEYAGNEPAFFDEVDQLKREGQAAFLIVMMILALALVAFYSFTA